MADRFRTIVDIDAGFAEASALAETVLDWLVATQVVESEPTDRVYFSDSGYPPGTAASRVVEWAADTIAPYSMVTNGLVIHTGREVFGYYREDGFPDAAICPACHTMTPRADSEAGSASEFWKLFEVDGLAGWFAGDDAAGVPCPACGERIRLVEWRWAGHALAFGCLGFTFWNWPPLRPEFLAEFAERLDGHRTIVVAGVF